MLTGRRTFRLAEKRIHAPNALKNQMKTMLLIKSYLTPQLDDSGFMVYLLIACPPRGEITCRKLGEEETDVEQTMQEFRHFGVPFHCRKL